MTLTEILKLRSPSPYRSLSEPVPDAIIADLPGSFGRLIEYFREQCSFKGIPRVAVPEALHKRVLLLQKDLRGKAQGFIQTAMAYVETAESGRSSLKGLLFDLDEKAVIRTGAPRELLDMLHDLRVIMQTAKSAGGHLD